MSAGPFAGIPFELTKEERFALLNDKNLTQPFKDAQARLLEHDLRWCKAAHHVAPITDFAKRSPAPSSVCKAHVGMNYFTDVLWPTQKAAGMFQPDDGKMPAILGDAQFDEPFDPYEDTY